MMQKTLCISTSLWVFIKLPIAVFCSFVNYGHNKMLLRAMLPRDSRKELVL